MERRRVGMEERVRFRVAKAKKRDVPIRGSLLVQEEEEEGMERSPPSRKIAALSDTWRPCPKESVSFVSERANAKDEEGSYGLQEIEGSKRMGADAEKGRLVSLERGKDSERWDHDLPEPCSLQVRPEEVTSEREGCRVTRWIIADETMFSF